jgi:outer membrane protein assembly factor BamB
MGLQRDFLYVGDGFDNTVKRFDAVTGQYLGVFVTSGSGGLNGPRGLLFGNDGNLLVSNQNVNSEFNGNVLQYNRQSGAFMGQFVTDDDNPPFGPRGIILSNDGSFLFVADLFGGQLLKYDGNSGEFLDVLEPNGFGTFFPRAVVISPHDGTLLVSVANIDNPLDGWVLRFDPESGDFLGIFIQSNNVNRLHRPEGLVFGPDGNLYITSFNNEEVPSDVDKILVFNGNTGAYIPGGDIPLYAPGQPRAFAQALLFGPNGDLFVPITGPFDQNGAPVGPNTGAVRRYDVASKTFTNFVLPATEGGPLGQPWYLTFRNTDPSTLEY